MGAAAPLIPVAATLLSTGLSTAVGLAGQAQQAQIAQNQANYLAQVARNNQQVAEWNAQRTLQQGQVDEDRQRQKTAQQIGAQRASLASQGGDINSGSDVDLIGDTARAGEFNAQTIRNNAQLNAWKDRLQGNLYGGQASLYGSQAANAWLPFNNSLLGGASSLGQRWAPLMN
jgi:hypothetical protein